MAQKKKQVADQQIIYKEEIPLYTITIYNDNETTGRFVIKVLEQVFEQTHHDSFLIMMRAHILGQAQLGVYLHDEAERIVNEATRMAREEGFPLKFSFELYVHGKSRVFIRTGK